MYVIMKYIFVFLLILLLNERQVEGVEICSCPDFNVHLTCKDTDTTELDSESNGYRCVAETGSTVTLQCDLTDADHAAVKSLTYKFYKTAKLDSKAFADMPTSDAKQLVCTEADQMKNTCTIENVVWDSTSTDDLDTYDSFIYQCSVEVTLIDDATFSIHSSTMWLDVFYNIVTIGKPDPDQVNKPPLDTDQPQSSLNCDLEPTNPPTNATWYYSTSDSDFLPVQLTARMILVDEKIDAESEGSFNIGTLVLMMFAPGDAGYYKCDAKYSTGSTIGTSTSFTVAKYQITASNNPFTGQSEVKKVSAITSSKYTLLGVPIAFTCYARDMVASEDIYKWKYKNKVSTNYEPVTPDVFPDVVISNYGRTLTFPSNYDRTGMEFKCEVKKTVNSEEITKMSEPFLQPVIVPKVMNVPLSSRLVCVNNEDSLITMYSSSAYMMSNDEEVAEYVQILSGSSYGWFLNSDAINGFVNTAVNGGIITEAKLVISSDNAIVAKQNLCQYYTFVQKNGDNYQLRELIKVSKQTDDRYKDLAEDYCTSKVSVACDLESDNPIVKITINDPSAPWLTFTVSKDGDILLEKTSSKTGETCSAHDVTFSFSKDDTGEASLSGEYTWSLTPECNTGCSGTIDIESKRWCPDQYSTETTPWSIDATKSCDIKFQSLEDMLKQSSPDGCYDVTIAKRSNSESVYANGNICNKDDESIEKLGNNTEYNVVISWTTASAVDVACPIAIRVECEQTDIPDGDAACGTWCITGILVAVLVVVILPLAILLFLYRKKKIEEQRKKKVNVADCFIVSGSPFLTEEETEKFRRRILKQFERDGDKSATHTIYAESKDETQKLSNWEKTLVNHKLMNAKDKNCVILYYPKPGYTITSFSPENDRDEKKVGYPIEIVYIGPNSTLEVTDADGIPVSFNRELKDGIKLTLQPDFEDNFKFSIKPSGEETVILVVSRTVRVAVGSRVHENKAAHENTNV